MKHTARVLLLSGLCAPALHADVIVDAGATDVQARAQGSGDPFLPVPLDATAFFDSIGAAEVLVGTAGGGGIRFEDAGAVQVFSHRRRSGRLDRQPRVLGQYRRQRCQRSGRRLDDRRRGRGHAPPA